MSDLISRQDAIDAIHNLYAIHGSEGSWIDQKDAFKALNSLPSAEPIRHGKWIFNPSDAFEAMFAKPKCSECGFESADGGNYCPSCGARMDEE